MTHFYFRRRKQILKRLMVTSVLFIFIFFSYALFRFVAFRLFHFDVSSNDLMVLFVAVFLLSFAYKPIDYLTLLLFKEVLFKSHVADHSVLTQLGRSLFTVLDQTTLANLIVNTFGEALHMKVVSVLVRDPSKLVYRMASAFGLKPSAWRGVELNASCLLIEILRTHRAPLERERVVPSFSWQEANQLRHDFEQLHASCVVPLMVQDELIGSVNLLPQGAVKVFTPQEIRSFFEFAREAAIAFGNAALFDELRESNEELMKIQSQFVRSAQHSAITHLATGIAHEIHNPLTIISGKAQVLLLKRDKIAFDAQVEEVLKTIVKQTKRAADITRKLIMFSQSHKSAKELIDFETVINDTIALLSYQVSLDQIQVVKRFEQPIPKWFGNMSELREAFLNLFLNAVQAIDTKGIIEVVVRYRETDQVIELRVSDSGPGIPESDLVQVFHPFFTTRHGASGLGLFVTQQIIHGYQGSIRAESESGRGATFIVELPVSEKTFPLGKVNDLGSTTTQFGPGHMEDDRGHSGVTENLAKLGEGSGSFRPLTPSPAQFLRSCGFP
ncbi:MAG: hypothetical protein HY584_03220 [Candidatus Omnitrophica bacterium]|nr:hypothetical protein [Candidatus Omnitrophota bacterium]